MRYVGMVTQQKINNIKSVILLISFPIVLLLLLYIGCFFYSSFVHVDHKMLFYQIGPFIILGVLIWFIIAYYINVRIIDFATDARSLRRSESFRVYNLVENLCISCGMRIPNIHVIEDDAMNAFASGVSHNSYTITLTTGIIKKLNDNELEAVIAHELTHIRNNDVRLLIISIVFVGIFALLSQISMRFNFYGRSVVRATRGRGGIAFLAIMIITMVLAYIGYGLSMLIRFAISRKREYMADAGAARLTRNPLALASALKKISGRSCLIKKQDESIAQLFIEHSPPERPELGFLNIFYSTHPPIEKRIRILEQF